MNEMPEKGFLRDYPLPSMLTYLSRNRQTGVLDISSHGAGKSIYVNRGAVAFASSTEPDDRLGEMLFKEDSITMAQYEALVKSMKKTGLRQGEVLVKLGLLTPKGLFEALKRQIRSIVMGLFHLKDGLYEFRPTELHPEAVSLDLSMASLIYDGIKSIRDWTRIKNEMPNVNSVFMMSHDPRSLFQDIKLSMEEKQILMFVDGERPIKDIVEASGLGQFAAHKVLYVLWTIGMVTEQFNLQVPALTIEDILAPVEDERDEFISRVTGIHSVLPSLGEHKLLAVEEGADFQEISRQYYRLAKEFHPDRYPDLAEEEKDKVADIFEAMERAYDTLRHRQLERKYTAGDEDLAQALLKVAQEELDGNNHREAARFLEEAVKSDPDNALCWHHLSLALRRLPGQHPRAEESALFAHGLDEDNAEFIVSLGQLNLDSGNTKEARAYFEQAYALDPTNTRAKDAVLWFKTADRNQE